MGSISFPGLTWVWPQSVWVALTSLLWLSQVRPKYLACEVGYLGPTLVHDVTTKSFLNGHNMVCNSVGHFQEVLHSFSLLKQWLVRSNYIFYNFVVQFSLIILFAIILLISIMASNLLESTRDYLEVGVDEVSSIYQDSQSHGDTMR